MLNESLIKRLKSRHLIWEKIACEKSPTNTLRISGVKNAKLVNDPHCRVPGFILQRS